MSLLALRASRNLKNSSCLDQFQRAADSVATLGEFISFFSFGEKNHAESLWEMAFSQSEQKYVQIKGFDLQIKCLHGYEVEKIEPGELEPF